VVTHNLHELKQQEIFLPAVHKIAEGGYDGKGVQLLKTTEAINEWI
jgi:5-(carboxyamino)imidazole ribonucleotide synthase